MDAEMDSNLSLAEEYPLKFLFTIGSLKELALTSLALDLWHQNQLGNLQMEKSSLHLTNFNCEQVIRATLPACITKLIDRRIHSMGRELIALYDTVRLFEIARCNRTFIKFFDCLTYEPDGKMSAERSVKNILTRHELGNIEKYKIACLYQFEDEIERLWPLVSDLGPFRPHSFVYCEFSRHWVEILRIASSEHHESLLFQDYSSAMLLFCNWTAFLHLLNTIRTEHQYALIKPLITKYKSENKYVLSKLNREQVNYLLLNFPAEIIANLAIDEGCTEHAFRIWNLVRNNIQAKYFTEMLGYLCNLYSVSEDVKFVNTQAQSVLLQVWITASDRLKMEFSDEEKLEAFFHNMYEYSSISHEPTDGMNFYFELFSHIPIEIRSGIWHTHWRKMIVRCPIDVLNRLLNLCLNDQDRIERFVEGEMLNLTLVKEIVDYWFSFELYEEIINYTKLCTWNESLVRELRKQIFLTSISSQSFGLNELIKLGEAMDKVLSNFDEVNDLKKSILSTDKVQKQFERTLRKGSAREAISAIECFWSTERSLFEKQIFLSHWAHFLGFKVNGKIHFDSRRWNEFLLWWVENKNDVPLFKEFLPADEIFMRILKKTVSNLSSRLGPLEKKVSQPVPLVIGKLEEFAYVDDFLMWYFGNESDVKIYKENKIAKYRKMTKLNNLLSISNQCIVNHILAWFFNDNLTKVERFKANFK